VCARGQARAGRASSHRSTAALAFSTEAAGDAPSSRNTRHMVTFALDAEPPRVAHERASDPG
jgi:hypothetical protein